MELLTEIAVRKKGPVAIDELEKAFHNKTITEAFGAGTAAVVALIQTIQIKGSDFHLPAYSGESVLKQKLEKIRTGIDDDMLELYNLILNKVGFSKGR